MNNNITSISSKSMLTDQAKCLGTLTGTYHAPTLSDPDILNALEHPLWPDGDGPSVFDMIRPGESVCLVVSDHTRKTAVDRVLPVLLRKLSEKPARPGAKCRLEDMFILVACGIHRHPTTNEMKAILGMETANAFEGRIFFHDPDDERNLVSIGTTRLGHGVRINRRAVEADRLILLGTALYHYHAGFGGGRKSLIPGLACRSTIAHSHSLTLDPVRNQINARAAIGVLDGNPVSEEILESARLHPPDFIVNTVLCPDGRLAGVFAGDMDTAHRAACRLVEQINRVTLKQAADFVIASAGGAANWIQSHKALFNAHRAIQPQGRMILVAPCREGLGDERFRYWVTRSTLEDIYQGLRQSPEVLGQTALFTRMRAPQTILVTRMSRRDIADLGIATAPDLDSAVGTVLEHFWQNGIKRPSYYLMPNASSLVPFIDPLLRRIATCLPVEPPCG